MPPLRRRDDRRSRGTVGELLREPDDPLFQLAHEVEVRLGAMNQVVDETYGELAGGKTDVFLGVGVDNVVDAGLGGAAGLAPGDLDPASFCSSRATCSTTCPARVPSRSRSRNPPG